MQGGRIEANTKVRGGVVAAGVAGGVGTGVGAGVAALRSCHVRDSKARTAGHGQLVRKLNGGRRRNGGAVAGTGWKRS